MHIEDEEAKGTFIVVLSILAIFTVAVIIIANWIGSHMGPENPAWSDTAVRERIAPVGQVYVGDEKPAVAAEPEKAMVAEETRSGDEIYQSTCFGCHGTGAAGAPKVGDTAAWSARIAKGSEALVANAINGFKGDSGFMPARGGGDLSDAAVQAAVEYMIAQSK